MKLGVKPEVLEVVGTVNTLPWYFTGVLPRHIGGTLVSPVIEVPSSRPPSGRSTGWLVPPVINSLPSLE